MDDTIKLLLQVGAMVAAIALAWGGFKWQLGHLTERDRKREAEFDAFRDLDRQRSHDLNLKLSGALEAVAQATTAMADFEKRRGDQIDSNTRRSRLNRTRIEELEQRDREAALRRLKQSGVPEAELEEITGVIRRAPETSATYPVAEKSLKRST